MTIKEILNEVFEDYAKDPYSKKHFGIWKNPTAKDLRNLIKEEKPISLRVLLDKKEKDAYVFNSDLLHDEAALKLFGQRSSPQRERFHHAIANNAGTITPRNFKNHASIQEVANWLKPPLKIGSE